VLPAGRAELARERKARSSRIETMIRTNLSQDEREILRQSIPILERMGAATDG
jgi:hypothetical protein